MFVELRTNCHKHTCAVAGTASLQVVFYLVDLLQDKNKEVRSQMFATSDPLSHVDAPCHACLHHACLHLKFCFCHVGVHVTQGLIIICFTSPPHLLGLTLFAACCRARPGAPCG